MIFENRLIFDLEDWDLGLTDEIKYIIIEQQWKKFFKHPQPYNIQIMKEFYSNMSNTSQKKLEGLERGRLIQYSQKIINMVFGVKIMEDSYQSLIEKLDEMDIDMVR